MAKTKIMITGDMGFIGTHLKEHLSKNKDFEILGFDIKRGRKEDVRDEKLVNDFMDRHKPDIVIHLAANPDIPTSVKEPHMDCVLNVGGTVNMLEASRKHDIKMFMFSSTAQVYGEPKQKKMDEKHPLAPKSPYAIGKLAAEQYINFYHEKYNLATVIFRFFNVYGEGQLDWVVVPMLIKRMQETKGKELEMYGSKEDSRDFVYVKDLCRAFELAIEKRPVGEAINLGTGKETFIIDLAKTIASILGRNFDYRYSGKGESAKITRMEADIAKAKKLIGWEPAYSLKQGVANVVKSKGL